MRKFLTAAWAWVCSWLQSKSIQYKPEYVEELPEKLGMRTIYIVGEGEHLWFLAMICPCGCGETLHMNLLPDTRPRWSVNVHTDNSVSISPSVWRKFGCRSHFFLRGSEVIWCDAG